MWGSVFVVTEGSVENRYEGSAHSRYQGSIFTKFSSTTIKQIVFTGNTPAEWLSTDYFGLTEDFNEFTADQKIYVKKSAVADYSKLWSKYAEQIDYMIPLPTISNKFATFSREFAVDLKSINPGIENGEAPNVLAFTAKNANYNEEKKMTYVTMVSINHTGEKLSGWSGEGDGTYIPAYTGVLLRAYKGTSSSDDYYQIAEEQKDGYDGTNLMASVTERSRKIQPVENGMRNFYVSGGQFWSFTQERTSTVHKSYLQLRENDAPSGAKISVIFDGDGDTTGIDSVSADEQGTDVIYNMQGQRVEKAVKGLYIKNGKKVYVK